MIARLGNYWRVWRTRGAATMDHRLWAYWALFGKYPALAAATGTAKTPKAVECEASQSGPNASEGNAQPSHPIGRT